jgi:hypothetical protein
MLSTHGPDLGIVDSRDRAVKDQTPGDGRLIDAPLGIRLGYFPAFQGADSVLLHGAPHQINALVPRLYEFLASPLQEWAVHDVAVVSRRHPARLFASKLGVSGTSGFRWRCTPAEIPSIQAMLQTLAVSGSGQLDFALAGSTARLVISAGATLETWWRQNA